MLLFKIQFLVSRIGGGRIRTFEGVSRQIYSLIPLTAREPLRKIRREFCFIQIVMSMMMRLIFYLFKKLKHYKDHLGLKLFIFLAHA